MDFIMQKRYKKLYSLLEVCLLVLASFFVFLGLTHYYFSLPPKAHVFTPGEIVPLLEEVKLERKRSFYTVGVYTYVATNRLDHFKFMWNHKMLLEQFSYREFENDKQLVKEATEYYQVAKETTEKKDDTIKEYLMKEYPEGAKLLSLYHPIKRKIGDSDSLAIVLGLIEEIENKNWTNHKKIVVTGSIDEQGNVLPVGAVDIKAVTAEKADADIFIVPAANKKEATTFLPENTKLKVVSVKTVKEAINWLEKNE
jgi:hypothetical protein